MSELVSVLSCGHTANAVRDDGTPSCAIDSVTDVTLEVDITERRARCGYGGCGRVQTSSRGLAFYEYKGPGSKYATKTCGNCGMHEVTHMEINPSTKRPGHKHGVCEFTPTGGAEYDEFYCGCRGWD